MTSNPPPPVCQLSPAPTDDARYFHVSLFLICGVGYALACLFLSYLGRRRRAGPPKLPSKRSVDAVADRSDTEGQRKVDLASANTGFWYLNGLVSDPDCLAVICNQVRINKTLHTLNLSSNSIGAGGARQLYACLKTNCTLRTLLCGRNWIKDEGAQYMAKLLRIPICGLEFLDLSWNSITSAGAASLSIALRTNKRLKSLKLDNNSAATLGALAILDSLEPNISLQDLSLASNGIENESSVVSHQLSHVFTQNASLRRLDLGDNSLTSTGEAEGVLAQALCLSQSLEHLSLRDCQLPSVVVQDIIGTLSKNSCLSSLDILGNSSSGLGPVLVEALQNNWSMTHLSCSRELVANVRLKLRHNRMKPWSIKLHGTFGYRQRHALATIVLCLHRLAGTGEFPDVPPELLLHIFTGLRRLDVCNS